MQYRYPGVKPFSTAERQFFFGREAEIEGLSRYILQERLVVLFARSGLGKSSLLNAGVIPRLHEKSQYQALSIRLGAWQAGKNADCVALTRAHLDMPPGNCYLDRLLPEDDSLWRFFKRYQALVPKQNNFVLVFDQFEELFTYPEGEIEQLHLQLGELLNSNIPQRYRQALESQPELLDDQALNLLYQPLDAKAVMAIRSDRLSELDRLSPKLPDILDKRYALSALSREQAEDAILNPAYLSQVDYALHSPRFDYNDAALDLILDHLSQQGEAEIESFQLQVICQYAERQVMRRGLREISPPELGDLAQIFARHYDDQIAELPDKEDQLAARKLIEEGLVFEEVERRLSLFEGSIQKDFGIEAPLLQQLVATHLLRAEPDPRGGFVYELSHDTLVAPVLAAKKRRLAEEERLRLAAQAEAENLRQAAELERQRQELAAERKKRQQSRMIAIGGVSLALIALLALFFALRQTNIAKEAEATAKSAQDSTQVVLNQLQTKQDTLDQALALAEQNASLAQKEAEKAREALQKAEQAEAQTAQRLSELQKANQQRVLDNLAKVDAAINALDFAAAESLLDEAAVLKVAREQLFDGYAELWYYYQEAAKTGRAAALMNKAFAAKAAELPSLGADSLLGLKTLFAEAVSPIRQKVLQDKYYPAMIPVEGGSFWMGSEEGGDESPRHQVQLSDFAIGRTEVTVLQWQIYCFAIGKAMPDKPSWGLNGDNPIMRVDWSEAVAYAAWLSERMGATYRLPTEAEWEYAARGGQQEKEKAYPYSGGENLSALAWFYDNSESRTQAVAAKKPNALGLYDMSGNVYEWCSDWYSRGYYEVCKAQGSRSNPQGPENGVSRVRRGGSWDDGASSCRVANRFSNYPDRWYNRLGFRLARSY
ncbi:MAG: SUMF1/EgtB/PvdO family nonheme iron enzyme [Bacteroidota bacterium]